MYGNAFNSQRITVRGIGGSKVTSISPQTKRWMKRNGYYNAAHPEEGTITIQDNMCGDGRIILFRTDTDVLVIYASANDITASAQIENLTIRTLI